MNDESYAAYEAKLARARQLRAEIMPHNKSVLFEFLSTAGIALVTIAFDGVGDSGQIEAVEAFGPDNSSLPLSRDSVTIKEADLDAGCAVEKQISVADYLEELAYDLLGSSHCGWEDGEGPNAAPKKDYHDPSPFLAAAARAFARRPPSLAHLHIHRSGLAAPDAARHLDPKPSRLRSLRRRGSPVGTGPAPRRRGDFPSFLALLTAAGGYRPSIRLDLAGSEGRALARAYDVWQTRWGDPRRAGVWRPP